MLERGIVVSYADGSRWALRNLDGLCPAFEAKEAKSTDIWHLDEVVITINGEKRYLWRAVDQAGYVLDEIVQIRRNTRAAKRLLERLLRKKRSSSQAHDHR